MKKTALSLALISFLLLSPTTVLAEEAVSSLTAIPPKVELSADPGETLTAKLRVRNETSTTQTYKIEVADFIVSDLEGTPVPLPTSITSRWSLRQWIQAPDLIPVDAKDTREITVTIKVPSSAMPGGHYAMLTYEPWFNSLPGDMKRTGSIIGQRTGTIFYILVNGATQENLILKRFTSAKFNEQGPVDFTGSLENQSDYHVTPSGTVTISNFLNQKVATLNFETGNIFPEAKKDFSSSWNQKWGYGKYRADLNVIYGKTGQVVTATIFFWLFPIRLTIYILILIIAALFVVIKLKERGNKHQQQLEAEIDELKSELKAKK
jgi:hypothetical protein